MSVPVLDPRPAGPAAVAPALALYPATAVQWKLQLQRAECSAEAPGCSHGPQAVRPDGERKDLESCGVPMVPAEPPAGRGEPVAPRTIPAEEPLPLNARSECEPDRAPVRLHVQPAAGDGVKVWLGIDGDATLVAQRASAAVADLRRSLQSNGERLEAVVCNGVAVFSRAPFPAAPPARTPPFLLKDSP